jgi:hypothetical protein
MCARASARLRYWSTLAQVFRPLCMVLAKGWVGCMIGRTDSRPMGRQVDGWVR